MRPEDLPEEAYQRIREMMALLPAHDDGSVDMLAFAARLVTENTALYFALKAAYPLLAKYATDDPDARDAFERAARALEQADLPPSG